MGFATLDGIDNSSPVKQGLILFKLRRQKWLIALTSVPLFVVMAAGLQLLPPTYKATASVTVESRTPRPPVRGSEAMPDSPVPFSEDMIGTEIAVLQSREIASQVVDRLNLMTDWHFNPYLHPSAVGQWKALIVQFVLTHLHLSPTDQPEEIGREREHSDTVEALARSVTFTPVARSRVISITVATWDKNLAAQIGNTVADLYISTHLGLTREMNTDANRFLSKRLLELRLAAMSSSNEVEKYRNEHGFALGATSTLVQEQLTTTITSFLDARNKLGVFQAQYNSVGTKNPEQLTSVINSPTITKLREVEAMAREKQADIASRYGAQSPQLVAYENMLANVRADIASEGKRIVQGLATDLQATKENVASVSARVTELRAQLSEMDSARAHLQTLQAESDAAQNLYSAFLNRSKETDASLLFPSTDVRIISRAIAPTRSATPQDKYITAAALASLGLATLCGLMVESRRKGLISSDEIAALFRVPAVGMIPLRGDKAEGIYRDAIEHLLNQIYFGLRARSILVTSAWPGEGKSATAKALADAASARGLRVLLIDGDLRSQAGRQTGTAVVGLAEVLRGEVDVGEAMQRSSDTRHPSAPGSSLTVLPAGRTRENPIQLLSLPPAQRIVATLEDQFDLTIIDGPPVLIGGDCWMLAQHVGHTIMMTKWRTTPHTAITASLKQLASHRYDNDHHQMPVVSGIVLNMVDPAKSRKLSDPDSTMYDPYLYKSCKS